MNSNSKRSMKRYPGIQIQKKTSPWQWRISTTPLPFLTIVVRLFFTRNLTQGNSTSGSSLRLLRTAWAFRATERRENTRKYRLFSVQGARGSYFYGTMFAPSKLSLIFRVSWKYIIFGRRVLNLRERYDGFGFSWNHGSRNQAELLVHLDGIRDGLDVGIIESFNIQYILVLRTYIHVWFNLVALTKFPWSRQSYGCAHVLFWGFNSTRSRSLLDWINWWMIEFLSNTHTHFVKLTL